MVLIFLLCLAAAPSLHAQEKVLGEGAHKGFILNDGNQVFKISPIKSGQTLQLSCSLRWTTEKMGKVQWRIEDQDRAALKTGSQDNPEMQPIVLEWTSNSVPKPAAYFFLIQGMGGVVPGEILAEFDLRIHLWDQNDGNAGTDAPESYEKALPLPISLPGTYNFDECFLSSTADIYDIYKIFLQPYQSLTLRAIPLNWKGTGQKGRVRWEFLNKSLKRLKQGSTPFAQATPFVVRVFHPRVKSDPRPALFYLLVKIEGEANVIYSLQAEVKEGP